LLGAVKGVLVRGIDKKGRPDGLREIRGIELGAEFLIKLAAHHAQHMLAVALTQFAGGVLGTLAEAEHQGVQFLLGIHRSASAESGFAVCMILRAQEPAGVGMLSWPWSDAVDHQALAGPRKHGTRRDVPAAGWAGRTSRWVGGTYQPANAGRSPIERCQH